MPNVLDKYLANYFKEYLKSYDEEPINVAKDSLVDMLTKVSSSWLRLNIILTSVF